MAVQIQTTIGAQEATVGGTPTSLRQNRTQDLVVSDGHARFMELVLQGNAYTGADLGGTAVTTQAGLSATTPALTLYNPIGSGVVLVLLKATVAFTAAPAAACGVMLAYNLQSAAAPTSTTLANVTNNLLGSLKLPIGQCYRIATLAAAPLACRFVGGTTGAAAIGGVQLVDTIDGELIIQPGVAVSLQTTSAGSVLASFSWEERPL